SVLSPWIAREPREWRLDHGVTRIVLRHIHHQSSARGRNDGVHAFFLAPSNSNGHHRSVYRSGIRLGARCVLRYRGEAHAFGSRTVIMEARSRDLSGRDLACSNMNQSPLLVIRALAR